MRTAQHNGDLQRVVALVALVLLGVGAVCMLSPSLVARGLPVLAAWLLAAFSLYRPGPGAAIAVLVAVLSGCVLAEMPWQVAMAATLGVWWACSRRWPELGALREPLGAVPWPATLFCAGVAPAALLLWLALLEPDLSDLTSAVPELSPGALLLGGAAFALVNATCEEWIWRGILQSRLHTLFSPRVAITIQALSFAIAHVHGFPRGLSGMVLAGVWAVLLGALRGRSRGLLAPILAHIVADATIAIVVIRMAQ